MRSARAARIIVGLAACTSVLAACGGGDSGGDSSAKATTTTSAAPKLPAACKLAPVTVAMTAGGEHPAGSDTFEATAATARRVPILPGEMTFDPAELSGLEKKAAVTPMAAYTLYLADFDLATDLLEGVSPVPVSPTEGQTLGALTVLPPTEGGLAVGDVITDGEPEYETTSTLKNLSLTVYADGDTTPQAYTDVTGQAEVLAVDDTTLCLDVDVTFENQGEPTYALKGVVAAPVVRAGDAFFYS